MSPTHHTPQLVKAYLASVKDKLGSLGEALCHNHEVLQ